MTQQDRDRLVALQKAKKGLITQREAAAEIGQSERHVRRLLKRLKGKGDAVIVHGLRGRRSNRKIDEKVRQAAIGILRDTVYSGFGPTLATEYLADNHDIRAGRETVRGWMIEGKLWRPKRQRIEKIHEWRQRRSRAGELVQWDTSEHAWLEDRGPKLYLISMIDDATSRIHARFVLQDSTEENMRLLWSYLEGKGRPLSFYTDKASLFHTASKVARNRKALPPEEQDPLPPTQIGRALQELDIVWIPAHSPQAKGRVERSFQTAQDRLVKGLRVARASTLEQANAYLAEKFIPWWNEKLTVVPVSSDDAHRPLAATHSLPASLSYVETRQVANDYLIQFDNKIYRIARRSGTGRSTFGRIIGGALPRRLRGCRRMSGASESGGSQQAEQGHCTAQEKPVDEQFPLHQPGEGRAVGDSVSVSGDCDKRQSVGQAKTARPASRLIHPKTAARELHQSRLSIKNQNPQSWPPSARPWGLVDICFGANSVAAVFGSAPGSATSPKHHSQTKPSPRDKPAKPDTSTWRNLGHFYLALTLQIFRRFSASDFPLCSGFRWCRYASPLPKLGLELELR